MGIIEIDKNLIPYTFDIELSGRLYTIEINYNYIFDFFTIDLYLDNKPLVKSEKLILNEVLFKDIYEDKEGNLNEKFPTEILIPLGNNDIKRITYDNFGKDVQLYYAERSELNE